MSSVNLKNEAKKYKFILFIAIGLIIISKCLLFYYYTQYKSITEALISEKQANLKLVQQFNESKTLHNEAVQQLVVLRDPQSQVVRMVGFDNEEDAVASIYWNTETQKVFVDVLNLPPAPEGKEYHLWAFKESKPIDAGVVQLKQGMQQLKDIADADSFVVTLEETGEVLQPSNDRYFLKAKVNQNS
ncbi:MAG: anti-sigma factor [Chitinophagales bacterium]